MRHLIFISLCSLLWTACGNTDNDFDASGTFEATEILVSSEANGKIMELNIEEAIAWMPAPSWVTWIVPSFFCGRCNSLPAFAR